MKEEVNKKQQKTDGLQFVPRTSMGPFHLLDSINEYLNSDYRYTSTPNGECTIVHFHDYDVSVFADADGTVCCLSTDAECIWEGKNIIGMTISEFQQNYHLIPDQEGEKIEMENGVQNVYAFDNPCMLIWTLDDKICCVQATCKNPNH